MATGIREVTLHLPEELADLLTQTAGRRALSQDALVEESLRYTLQPLAQQALGAFRRAIQKQQADSPAELQARLEASLPEKDQTRLTELLECNRNRELTLQERAELDALHCKIEAVATEKAATLWLLAQNQRQAD